MNPHRRNLLDFCVTDNLQVVRKICTNPLQKHEIFLRDHKNRTALHIAVRSKKVEIVKFLLGQPGIDIRARTHDGDTALLLGCGDRFVPLDIIKLLIAKDPEGVHLVDNDLRSPLLRSFQPRRPDVTRFLIEQGHADPNYKDQNGEHALFYAVRHFEPVTIKFLMNESTCDVTHRNHNDQAAFETFNYYAIKDCRFRANFSFVKMFRLTYDEFSSPKVLGGLLRFCIIKYRDSELKRYACNNDETDALRRAILEIFYESPRTNPDYYKLVARIMAENMHSADTINKYFWRCLPFQSKEVLERFDDIFRFGRLIEMFRLFVHDREIFDEHLPKIAESPLCELSSKVSIYFEKCTDDPSKCGYLLKFFKSLCWMGFKLDLSVLDIIEHPNLSKILYPLLPFVRPFIRGPTELDTWICQHFEETDSVQDVARYKTFKINLLNGSGFGFVPTLFNLSRTVVRQTAFEAADSKSEKLFNLHTLTLEFPIPIKERLFYL